jgi:protocatechuate 3,4-dioxygenase beta subunit
MDNDDAPIGRILKRREVLALFGSAGVSFLAGCATQPAAQPTRQSPTALPATAVPAPTSAPAATRAASSTVAAPTAVPVATSAPLQPAAASPTTAAVAPSSVCVVSPAMTEGPYFVDEKLNRSDIQQDPSDGSVRAGALMNLSLRVSQVRSSGCTLLPGAIVDIWHCDAQGLYSDVVDGRNDLRGKKFLRGHQITDAGGLANFVSIFPGWYSGRAVHIHFKVRAANREFTSQLFFDEADISRIYAQQPYAAKGRADTPNARDGIFRGGGSQLTVKLAQNGAAWSGLLDIGMAM